MWNWSERVHIKVFRNLQIINLMEGVIISPLLLNWELTLSKINFPSAFSQVGNLFGTQ